MAFSRDIIAESILLELILSVSAETDEDKIIKKSLRFYLRKVQCFAVAIFQYKGRKLLRKGLMPVKLSEINDLEEAIVVYESEVIDELPLVFSHVVNNTYYQFFRLRDYGVIVLVRKNSLGENVVKELLPVIDNLGKSLSLAYNIKLRELAEAKTKKVLENLQMLERFIEGTRDALQVTDVNGKVVFLNNEAKNRLGIYLNDTRDYFVWDFEPYFTNASAWQEHVKSLRVSGQITVEAVNINLITKKPVPVELTVDISEIDGEEYVIAVSRDITERKKAELEISRKEQLLRAISLATNVLLSNENVLQSIADSLQILGEAVEVDRSYLFIRHPEEEQEILISQVAEWCSNRASSQINNPEMKNQNIQDFRELANSILNNEPFIALTKELNPMRPLRKFLDRQEVLSMAILPIFKEGKFWGCVGFNHLSEEKVWTFSEISILKTYVSAIEISLDNESQKETIESMALFPALNPNAVIRTDLKGGIILQNDAAEQIDYVFWEDEKMLKTTFFRRIAEHFSDAVKKLQVEVFQAPSTYFLVDCLLVDERDAMNFYFNDISKLKEQEKQLRLAKVKAETSERAKEQFIANMSHEIRTPLHAINGISNILKKSNLDDADKKLVEHIGQSGSHLQSLINNILDFSKIAAGEFELNPSIFSFKEMVEQINSIVFALAEDKKLDLFIELDEHIEEQLIGDEIRLRQVLLNLLSNALKFTEQGFVSLKAKVLEGNQQEQLIEILIEDSGIGMSEDFLKRIFRKFSQEDASNDRKYSGTGLGMAITKELIELMLGKITVSSEKGKGTQFTIQLPFEIEKINPDIQANELYYAQILKNKKVLVVEDNEINMLVINSLLQSYDMIVYEAKNGLEALNHPHLMEVDLLFMDLQMPIMNGFEATEKLRQEQGLKTPIIALTANAIKTEIDKCFDLGMNDYVLKPFDESHLIEILAKNLNKTNNQALINETNGKKNSALYNLQSLKKISKNSTVFMNKLLSLFVDRMPKTIEQLKIAFEEKDYKKTKALAHKIKPNFVQIGISALEDELMLLNYFKEEDKTELRACKQAINKMEEVMELLIHDFNKILEENSMNN